VGDYYHVRCTSKFAYGPDGRPEIKLPTNPSQNNISPKEDTVTTAESNNDIIIPAIPPNTDLEYEIEIIQHIDTATLFADHSTTDSSSETNTERNETDKKNDIFRNTTLYDVTLKKECGNRWFSYRDYNKAARSYAKGSHGCPSVT
jgi:hypothetical protein